MLTIMLKTSALCSRLMFVFASVCAAVMSFIMCSDAARATPITTQVDNAVKHNVLNGLYTQYSQQNPLFTSLLSAETGLQTGTNSETQMGGNYREASSIIYHQSNPLPITEGSFSYSQNIPDNRQFRAGITGVLSEVRPASSIITSNSQERGQSFERLQSRQNKLPLSQEGARSGDSYHSYPVIIRKSSHKEAASPFHHSSRPSRAWEPKDAQKSFAEEKVPRQDSPQVAEDETVWQPSHSALFSSQTSRYQSTSLPSSRGHYSSYKETNEFTVAGPSSTSSRIQSSKFPSFASQTAPHAPSISNNFDASVIKSNPSPEKLSSSITDNPRGFHPVSSSETPKHKKVQSYLFKDSQTSSGGHETIKTVTADGPSAFITTLHQQRPSDAQVHGRFSSSFKQLRQRGEPTREVHLSDNANALYHTANVAQHDAQTDSFTNYQRTTAETQMSAHPAPRESSVPMPHADFQGKYGTGSEKSAVSSLVNATARGSMLARKPGQTIKNIYGLRGFQNPISRAAKEPTILSSRTSDERINSRRHSFDKGKFRIANLYPSLSPKYSFGQRQAPTTPSKPERTPTDYSSPSPSTKRPFTSGLKEAQPLLPESDASPDSDPDPRRFRIYRRIYGLKGFETRPLEGAKPLASEPEKSARVHQSFEGFKLRSSQIWQPKSSQIHEWNNKTEPGSSHESTVSQNERSTEGLKPLLKTEGGTEAVTRFTPGKYNKKTHRIYTPLGFHPVPKTIGITSEKTPWRSEEQNPTAASASHRISSSSYLRSAGDLEIEPSPKSEPRTPNRTGPVVMKASLFSSSTSSVRGQRVKGKHTHGEKLSESPSLTTEAGNVAIVRLNKRPVRVKAVTYADVLGSASFSGVRSTAQTPTDTPAHQDSFPNTTATIFSSEEAVHGDNTSRGPEAHAEDEGEEFSSVEENKLDVKIEGVDVDMKASHLFPDDEGSGSGGFNTFDVFSTHATKSQGLSEDLLELDYLRISTGNISFKSMKLSHAEK